MSELKFRAWSNEYDHYCSGLQYDSDFGWEGILESEFEYQTDPEPLVELYTGLKDKNGKEIYEGDIVREVIDTGLEDIDGEYEYIVQWNDDFKEFTIQTTPKNRTSFHDELYQLNMSREVIGNIHENPELLEGEK